MQGFVTAEVLSQQQHGKVGRSLSVVSVSLFFKNYYYMLLTYNQTALVGIFFCHFQSVYTRCVILNV